MTVLAVSIPTLCPISDCPCRALDARVLGRLSADEAKIVVALRLARGERLTLADVVRIVGYRDHSGASRFMARMQRILPTLRSRPVDVITGGAPQREWFLAPGEFS